MLGMLFLKYKLHYSYKEHVTHEIIISTLDNVNSMFSTTELSDVITVKLIEYKICL
jgi:hypothetical protein